MDSNGCREIEQALMAAEIFTCDVLAGLGQDENLRFLDIRLKGLTTPSRVLNVLHKSNYLAVEAKSSDEIPEKGQPKLRLIGVMDNCLMFEDVNV